MIACSQDGSRIASIFNERKIRIWDPIPHLSTSFPRSYISCGQPRRYGIGKDNHESFSSGRSVWVGKNTSLAGRRLAPTGTWPRSVTAGYFWNSLKIRNKPKRGTPARLNSVKDTNISIANWVVDQSSNSVGHIIRTAFWDKMRSIVS